MKTSLLYIIALMTFFGCKQQGGKQHHRLPVVVTTTGMIADAVANIAGDSAVVMPLMGPGVDPHLYKATQGDLAKLTNADIIFYNGLHLEGKMAEILEKLGRTKPVIPVSKDIPLNLLRTSTQYNNQYDPHIWFDASLWKIAVNTISGQLTAEYPGMKAYFEANTETYSQRLDSLGNWVREQMSQIPEKQRVLITAHDAFGYFGRAYKIDVKGLQGISTLSEFGLRDITELVTFIVENRIKAVFIETSVSERSINAVVEGCGERGFEIVIGGSLYSDAMGEPGTPEGNYIGMFRSNVNKIVNALK